MLENKNVKILVTDNDQDFLAVAEHKLSMRGFQVIISPLNEAVKVMKKEKVDFIFMDINKTTSEGAPVIKHIEALKIKPLIHYFGLNSNNEVFQNLGI